MEYTTIEAFFLSDYERQREYIEELERRVNELEQEISGMSSEYGVADLHKPITVVRYDVEGAYYIAEYYDFTSDEIRDLLALSDNGLYEYAIDRKRDKSSWDDRLLKRSEKKYHYTVHVKETRKECDAYFDKVGDYIKQIPTEASVGEEVPIRFDAQSKQYAIDMLRENLEDALDRIVKREEKQDAAS